MGRLFIAQILSYNKEKQFVVILKSFFIEIGFLWNWFFHQMTANIWLTRMIQTRLTVSLYFLRVSLEPIQNCLDKKLLNRLNREPVIESKTCWNSFGVSPSALNPSKIYIFDYISPD